MAQNVSIGGSLDVTPAAKKQVTPASYLSNLAFVQQYLPDTYEKEFEKYGNRSISSFLRMVGAEMPTSSDLIQWAEQGRLHLKYSGVKTAASAGDDTATLTGLTDNAIRKGQTVLVSDGKSGGTATGRTNVRGAGRNHCRDNWRRDILRKNYR